MDSTKSSDTKSDDIQLGKCVVRHHENKDFDNRNKLANLARTALQHLSGATTKLLLDHKVHIAEVDTLRTNDSISFVVTLSREAMETQTLTKEVLKGFDEAICKELKSHADLTRFDVRILPPVRMRDACHLTVATKSSDKK